MMKENLAHLHQKELDGKIRERDHLLRRPLIVEGDEKDMVFNSAGGGCFARPVEYCGRLIKYSCLVSPLLGIPLY